MISGTARGVRLLAPGEGTRPLGDRVKQALFAAFEGEALGAWPAPFLDLYAGSGAAGIEALSRGAPAAVFVERDPGAARVIRENVLRAAFAPGSDATPVVRIARADVLGWLALDPEAPAPFGAVLIDPPYGDAAIVAAMERLGDAGRGWLTPGAVVVAKHFWRDPLPPSVGTLDRRRERRFGETMLSFYVNAEDRA